MVLKNRSPFVWRADVIKDRKNCGLNRKSIIQTMLWVRSMHRIHCRTAADRKLTWLIHKRPVTLFWLLHKTSFSLVFDKRIQWDLILLSGELWLHLESQYSTYIFYAILSHIPFDLIGRFFITLTTIDDQYFNTDISDTYFSFYLAPLRGNSYWLVKVVRRHTQKSFL